MTATATAHDVARSVASIIAAYRKAADGPVARYRLEPFVSALATAAEACVKAFPSIDKVLQKAQAHLDAGKGDDDADQDVALVLQAFRTFGWEGPPWPAQASPGGCDEYDAQLVLEDDPARALSVWADLAYNHYNGHLTEDGLLASTA